MSSVLVGNGYYWSFAEDVSAEDAAAFLARRSQKILLHVEPVAAPEEEFQSAVRAAYFAAGGEAEEDGN